MQTSSKVDLSMKVQDLKIGFADHCVAEELSFTLQQKEIIVVAGPNGAGKSTLLKTMARIQHPLSGTVQLCKEESLQNIWSLTPRQYAQKVAYLPQSIDLRQDLTVMELVSLGRNPHQNWWSWIESQTDRQAIKEALEKTCLLHLRHKPLASLSGGEQQRATMALALAQQPQFMLLDEPASHLDFRHQLELAAMLKHLSSDGLGILIVLHDLNLMSRLADKILLLNKPIVGASQIVASGAPDTVLAADNLKLVYQINISITTDPATGKKFYSPDTLAVKD